MNPGASQIASGSGAASEFQPATTAINALGLDLLASAALRSGNALCAPYSVQQVLAMAYGGAGGATRQEMARVLHYPEEEGALHAGMVALRKSLEEIVRQSQRAVEQGRSGAGEPTALTSANRLFGQEGFEFLPPCLATLQNVYEAPLKTLDFAGDPEGAGRQINEWVEDRTNWRISGLIRPGALDRMTRLVLVNAVFLKARWETPFRSLWTEARRFHLASGTGEDVPTMRQHVCCGLELSEGFKVLTVPYSGGGLHLLIVLPDDIDGLGAIEKQLSEERLQECAKLPQEMVHLFLPKFDFDPPGLSLRGALCDLGMTTAFDLPAGSANFERLAPRVGDNYLSISEVVHQTFLKLDEHGTEAAAATAAVARAGSASWRKEPVEIHVDRPFLFAIQHRASGACLFLGRVVDPRL
jgi:serpin B